MDTNNYAPNIFQDLTPSLVPDLILASRSSYSLEQPKGRSVGGSAAPLIFGGNNDVIDFRTASNNRGINVLLAKAITLF